MQRWPDLAGEWYHDEPRDDHLTLADLLPRTLGLVAYECDLGEDVRHRVELVEVIDDDLEARRLRVVDASGPSPRARAAGPWSGPGTIDVVDPVALERILRREFDHVGVADDGWTWLLNSLASRVAPDLRLDFWAYLDAAQLRRPVPLDAAAAAECLVPYRWLLDQVGSDGLELTEKSALAEANSREATVRLIANGRAADDPVGVLVTGAIRGGLVRRRKGRLVKMAAARDAEADSCALLRLMAVRWLDSRQRGIGADGSLLLALELARGSDLETEDLVDRIAYGLDNVRWTGSGRTGMTSTEVARDLVAEDLDFFSSLGLLTTERAATAENFARAALRMR